MREFEYVSRKEAAPHKENLINLVKAVQKEVKPYFTFRFDFIGSSSRNMITREVNGNIGYDFDLNIEPKSILFIVLLNLSSCALSACNTSHTIL